MKKKSKINISCPNPRCKDFNIIMTRRLLIACSYKVFHGRITRKEYLCETCHTYFSETYGTFAYRRKKPDLLEGVLDHQVRGIGVRDSAELACVSKDTVEQVILDVGFRIEQWFRSLEIQIPKGNIEYDEMWTFVAKKHSGLENEGEMWLWIAFHRENRMLVHFVIGKHTGENGFDLVEGAKKLIESASQHHSDELPCYAEIFREVYGTLVVPQRTGKVGRPRKPYLKADQDLKYGQVHKTRVKGKIKKVSKISVYGQLKEKEISTSKVERHNLNVRQDHSRSIRKTLKFSKDLDYLVASFWIYFYYYNFMRPHLSLRQEDKDYRLGKTKRKWIKRTPAMAAGLYEKALDWQTVLNDPLRGG